MNSPHIGPKEPMLQHRKTEYRYTLYKSYKIIYSIDIKLNYIKIHDVFDTRQNPHKLRNIK